MGIKIGELFVDVKANVAKFTADMDKATAKGAAFGAAVGVAVGNLALRFAELGYSALRSIPAAIEETVKLGEHLHDTSMQVGTTVETLHKLEFAASQSGVASDQLTTGLVRFNRNISEAARGSKEAAENFARLGVNVKGADGEVRPMSDILADVADKFEAARDGANKTGAALAFFGRSGAAFIPFLNEGSKGAKEWGDQMERAGSVMSDKLAGQSDALGDKLKVLAMQWDGVKVAIGGMVIPKMLESTEWLSQWISDARGLWKAYADEINSVGTAIDNMMRRFGGLGLYRQGEGGPGALGGDTFRGRGASGSWGPPVGAEEKPDMPSVSPGAEPFKVGELIESPLMTGGASLFSREENLAIQRKRSAIMMLQMDLQKKLKERAEEGEFIQRRDFDDLLKLPDALKNVTVAVNEIAQAGEEMSAVFAQGFQDAMLGARSFTDALAGIGKQIIAMIVNMTVTKPLTGALSGILGSVIGAFSPAGFNAFGGIGNAPYGPPIPKMAGGGRVSGGSPVIVGDGGEPEMFWPDQAGTVIPRSKTGGMNRGSVVITMNVYGDPDSKTLRNLQRMMQNVYGGSVETSLKAAQEVQRRTA